MSAKDVVGKIVEELASVEHERWAHWQRYMHNNAIRQPDGSLIIPAKLVEKWERQIETPYEKLSEKEKDSDREQVQKYVPIIIRAFSE